MCSNSTIGLNRLSQIPGNCECKRPLVSSSAPRTSTSSFLFHCKVFVLHNVIESLELPHLVPRQHNGDFFKDLQPRRCMNAHLSQSVHPDFDLYLRHMCGCQ